MGFLELDPEPDRRADGNLPTSSLQACSVGRSVETRRPIPSWPSSHWRCVAGPSSSTFQRLDAPFGAVREFEIAAAAVGIDVKRVKLRPSPSQPSSPGAGGLYTTFSTFIHPESLGFQTTILVLTMVVVGGIGSVSGIGARSCGLIAELLRQ